MCNKHYFQSKTSCKFPSEYRTNKDRIDDKFSPLTNSVSHVMLSFKALDYVLAGSGTGIGIGIGIGAGGKSTEEEDKGDGCMKHILPEPTVVKCQKIVKFSVTQQPY